MPNLQLKVAPEVDIREQVIWENQRRRAQVAGGSAFSAKHLLSEDPPSSCDAYGRHEERGTLGIDEV